MQLCPQCSNKISGWRWVTLWITGLAVGVSDAENNTAFVSLTGFGWSWFFRIPCGHIIKFTVRQLCRSRPILRSGRQEMVLRFWCLFFVKWWRLEPIVFRPVELAVRGEPSLREGVLFHSSISSQRNGQKNIIISAVILLSHVVFLLWTNLFIYFTFS